MYSFGAPQTMPMLSTSAKGKERASEDRFAELSEDQWEAEFAKFATSTGPRNQTEELDPILQEDLDNQDPLLTDLDAKWRDIQTSLDRQSAADKEMAAWEAQYGSQFVDPDGEYATPLDGFNVDELLANPPEWNFTTTEEENMFKDHADPYVEGLRLLEAGAPFIEVEHAFEEACKRDPQRSEAWTALGETLAADEKELLAIKALERAVASGGRTATSAWLVRDISFGSSSCLSRCPLHRAWRSLTSTRDTTLKHCLSCSSGSSAPIPLLQQKEQ